MKIKLSTFNLLAMLVGFFLSIFTGRLTGDSALVGWLVIISHFSHYLKDWEWDVEQMKKNMKAIATYKLNVK